MYYSTGTSFICTSISAIFCHLAAKYDHESLTYYNNKFPHPIFIPRYEMVIDKDEMEMMVYPGLFPSVWPI